LGKKAGKRKALWIADRTTMEGCYNPLEVRPTKHHEIRIEEECINLRVDIDNRRDSWAIILFGMEINLKSLEGNFSGLMADV